MPESPENRRPDTVPSVGAVVVTWNRKEHVLECIKSLRRSAYPRLEIYVVDNSSSDGTAPALEETYPDVRLFRSSTNTGFAGGNNLALSDMLGEGIDAAFLVNDDAVVAEDTLDVLLATILDDPSVGAAAAKVLEYAEPGRIWAAGGLIRHKTGVAVQRFHGEPDDGRADEPAEVDYGVGCAMIVRMEAIRRVGLMDPRYFMYYEEADWCRRMRLAGYRILYVPESRAWHKVHLNGSRPNNVAYYFARNRLLYLEADGDPTAVRSAAVDLIRSGIVHMLKGRSHDGRLTLRGVADYHARRFGRLGSNGD